MFEESVSTIPSIWASMNSWFTPTVLFVLLNLMIGTILVTSGQGTHKHNDQQKQQQQTQQDPQPQHLARSPSMLQRLKSINLYAYRSQEPTPSQSITTTIEGNPEILETHYSSVSQTREQEQQQEQEPPSLNRSPSMLQMFKSINLYNYISQEPTSPPTTTTTTLHKTQETGTHYTPQQTHYLQEQEDDEDDEDDEDEQDHDQEQTLDEIYNTLQSNHVSRTKSDTKPASGEVPERLPRKMKKSASAKSAFAHFEEEDIVEARRPATVRGRNAKATEVDDEVDARADDFINKFREQLKLQRVDSIMRNKEMISRGSGK